jgi:hypothetical protein
MKIPGFENWGLKLLALILAIVTYHALKDSPVKHDSQKNDRKLFQYR